MQPKVFRQLRADLASMWRASNKSSNLKKVSANWSAVVRFQECEEHGELDEEETSMKVSLLALWIVFLILNLYYHVLDLTQHHDSRQ